MNHMKCPEELILALYNERKNDCQIGEALGMTRKNVTQWRNRRHLPNMTTPNGKGRIVSQETRIKIVEGIKSSHFKRARSGFRKRARGYVEVNMPDHPRSNKGGYILHHRLVMESKIGRNLTRNEVVHHINGITNDNRLENLKLLSSREHTLLHANERRERGRTGKVTAGIKEKLMSLYPTKESLMDVKDICGSWEHAAKYIGTGRRSLYLHRKELGMITKDPKKHAKIARE